jgi:hypothetical protein
MTQRTGRGAALKLGAAHVTLRVADGLVVVTVRVHSPAGYDVVVSEPVAPAALAQLGHAFIVTATAAEGGGVGTGEPPPAPVP